MTKAANRYTVYVPIPDFSRVDNVQQLLRGFSIEDVKEFAKRITPILRHALDEPEEIVETQADNLAFALTID